MQCYMFLFLAPQTNKTSHPFHSMANALSSKHPQNDVVLPRPVCCIIFTVVILLCGATTFVFWPSNPQVQIERVSVRLTKVHLVPQVGAVVRVSVSVKVRNGDVYWMELREVDVGLKYRGKKLGHVEAEGWHVRGWGWCYVDGEVEFSGLPATDVVILVEDMAKGKAYFHASVEVSGQRGLAFYRLPYFFKIVWSCEMLVNTKSHSILYQHCIRKD